MTNDEAKIGLVAMITGAVFLCFTVVFFMEKANLEAGVEKATLEAGVAKAEFRARAVQEVLLLQQKAIQERVPLNTLYVPKDLQNENVAGKE